MWTLMDNGYSLHLDMAELKLSKKPG
ncbi:hypothetical protein VCR31J2_1290035 [Vibrio coralliirubri]|uniref:Uncharacterized protein n=1 Tax=Vibrio coralliirubri TaxID=1516159 RepID=A0AA87C1K9_9VIBR|nr:hypothetical protein VCR31J2_1290035 [Vibrio coralliirubri]